MVKINRFLALAAAVILLFTFAACDNSEENPTTNPTEISDTYSEPGDIPAANTDVEQDTSAPDESSTDEAISTTVDATDVSQSTGKTDKTETTTKPSTASTASTAAPNKAPSGKAEIIAYTNKVMKTLREKKPGYSMRERTHIDDTRVSSESSVIDSVGPPIIKGFQGTFSKWSPTQTVAKGGSHAAVSPKVDIQSAWVKSATCSESGGNYTIRITFVDERVATLPAKKSDTMHGKVMTCNDAPMIKEGAGDSIDMKKFDCLYSNSYLTLTVDKATGAVKKTMHYVDAQVNMTVKVPVVPVLSASIPIANETEFTLKAY